MGKLGCINPLFLIDIMYSLLYAWGKMKGKDTKTSTFSIDGVDDKYLQAFGRLHYLTARQVTSLFYSPKSITTVQTRLKNLADNEYLLALALPTIRAKSPYVYTLSSAGRDYVKTLGIQIAGSSFRASKEQEKGYQFFAHTLAVTDFLISVEVLVRSVTGLRLVELLHDLTLKHDPPMLRINPAKKDGKKIPLVPDGWIDLSVVKDADQERRYCFWLELDRGTMSVKPLKKRIRDIITLFTQGGVKTRFGTNKVQFLFATTANSRRVEFLLRCIREELENIEGIKSKAWWFKMFAVTPLPSQLDPKELFLGKVWDLAREDSPKVSLLNMD